MVSQIRTYMMRHVTTTLIWNRNNVGTHKCHGAAPRATPCCRTFLWPRPNWYRFPRPTNDYDDLTDCRNLTFTGTGASSRGSGGVSMAIMRLSPALLLAYAYSSSTSNAQSIFDRAPDLCHQSCGRTSKYAYRAPTQDKSFTHSGWPASSGSTRHGTSSGGWMGGISRGDCGCWGRLEVDVSLTYPGTARSNIRLTEEAVCWLRGTTAILV